MKNRISEKFQKLKARKKTALVAFVTAGYPDLKTTAALIPALERAGVDIVELGIPFSDPIADGPTIQESSCRALRRHVTVEKIFGTVKRIRQSTQIPIAFMTYYNIVFHYGQENFLRRSHQSGVDGLIVPDLPLEEAGPLRRFSREHRIANIFFLSSTTDPVRGRRIAAASTGFVYYISLLGVTGARSVLPRELKGNIRRVKGMTDKPVCVGFGISRPSQVRALAGVADGVIVGSAIIKQIQKTTGKKDMIARVSRYVRSLSRALSA